MCWFLDHPVRSITRETNPSHGTERFGYRSAIRLRAFTSCEFDYRKETKRSWRSSTRRSRSSRSRRVAECWRRSSTTERRSCRRYQQTKLQPTITLQSQLHLQSQFSQTTTCQTSQLLIQQHSLCSQIIFTLFLMNCSSFLIKSVFYLKLPFLLFVNVHVSSTLKQSILLPITFRSLHCSNSLPKLGWNKGGVMNTKPAISRKRCKIKTETDCAVENDGSLVIGEFVDERGVQFWSCRRESSCHMAKRWGCCEIGPRLQTD